MRFPYCSYEFAPAAGAEGLLYRPVIRIHLSGPLASAEFWALLDTGADESYITRQMAEFLGIEPIAHTAGKVHSASGSMEVRYGEVDVELGAGSEHCAWRAIVGIVDETWPEAILGHRGALEHFDATFLGAEKAVVLAGNRPSTNLSLG